MMRIVPRPCTGRAGVKRLSHSRLALEAHWRLECAREPYGNLGCAGGDFVGAFEYLLAAKGLDSEVDYPYTARDGFGGGRCWTAAAERHVAAIDGYSIVKSNSSAARRSGVCFDPLPDTSSPR